MSERVWRAEPFGNDDESEDQLDELVRMLAEEDTGALTAREAHVRLDEVTAQLAAIEAQSAATDAARRAGTLDAPTAQLRLARRATVARALRALVPLLKRATGRARVREKNGQGETEPQGWREPADLADALRWRGELMTTAQALNKTMAEAKAGLRDTLPFRVYTARVAAGAESRREMTHTQALLTRLRHWIATARAAGATLPAGPRSAVAAGRPGALPPPPGTGALYPGGTEQLLRRVLFVLQQWRAGEETGAAEREALDGHVRAHIRALRDAKSENKP